MGYTSIQIDSETKKKLASLKSNKRETYDEILNKLMSLIPQGDEEGEYADEFKFSLLNTKLDVKQNRVISHKQLKRKLGVK